MSARDNNNRPRRFKGDNDSKSGAYRRSAADEFSPRAGEAIGEQDALSSVKFPSKVSIPAEKTSARKNPYLSTNSSSSGKESKYMDDETLFALIFGTSEDKKETPEAKSEEPEVKEEPISETPATAEEPADETAEVIAGDPAVQDAPAEEPAVKSDAAEEIAEEFPAEEGPADTAEDNNSSEEISDEVRDDAEPVEEQTSAEAPESDASNSEEADTEDTDSIATAAMATAAAAAVAEEAAEEDGAAASDKESFDYIITRRHSKHRHHHSSHSSESDDTDDDDFILTDDNPDHYARLQQAPKPKKQSKAKKIIITVVSVILALVIAAVSTFFIMREIGRSKMHSYNKIEISAPDKDESGNPIDTLDATGRVIKYNGVSYAFNENVASVVFIGTDEGTTRVNKTQMGDAIYALAIDTKTGSIKILGISRDTMSDVDVYSEEGKFIDTEKLQMAYAYAYSSETVTGGHNTLTSISRLFYGLPLNDYFAINLDALTTLNDAIGGVTLTSSMTFVSPEDGRTIYEGQTVTLHGEEAERYVRSRDKSELESNNDRMQRQQEYIKAFITQIFPSAKKDISTVSNLYSAIKENSDTTLDLTKITYLASVAMSHMNSASDIEYINLKGKIVQKGDNAQMYVSNEESIKTMLDIFYTPINGANSDSK